MILALTFILWIFDRLTEYGVGKSQYSRKFLWHHVQQKSSVPACYTTTTIAVQKLVAENGKERQK